MPVPASIAAVAAPAANARRVIEKAILDSHLHLKMRTWARLQKLVNTLAAVFPELTLRYASSSCGFRSGIILLSGLKYSD
jgi:hypothetical protein